MSDDTDHSHENNKAEPSHASSPTSDKNTPPADIKKNTRADTFTLIDADQEFGFVKRIFKPVFKPWFSRLSRRIMLYSPLWFFLQSTSYGTHRIPRKGGAIIASNHASFFDPLVIGSSFPRSLRFFARFSLFRNPFFRWVIQSGGAIPARRGESDFKAIRKVVRRLKAGDLFVVFPEGTRTMDGELQPLQPGVAALATMANVPIIPAYVHGSYEAWRRGAAPQLFRRLYALFGEPIDPGDAPPKSSKREVKAWIVDMIVMRMKELEQEARTRWPLRNYPQNKHNN